MRRTIFALLPLLLGAAETKIKLPTSHADLVRGEKLFQVNCAPCHGPKGEGGRGPLLAKVKLSHAPDDTALVQVISNGIRGTEMPGADTMDEHEVRQTAAFVRSLGRLPAQAVPGDAAKGAEVYRKGNCANCHSIRGEGGVAGPDLTTIGDARSAKHLRESVVDPGAVVPDGYLLVTVKPKDGAAVTWARLNEDSFSIQVRDASGRIHSFWKSDVAQIEKQRGKSPMPSYKGQLADAELTDLVAYLASLKEAQTK